MYIQISDIQYQDLVSSNARLIQYTIPSEGQTYLYIPQQGIDSLFYTLSSRNGSGAYILPMQLDSVFLNFVPRKTVVSNLTDYVDTEFTFFAPEPDIVPTLFTLPDGMIFRCVSPDSLPLSKENYVYYIMEEGKKKVIPNYQTLEVMLFERSQNLLSVRVITEKQCSEIPPHESAINDKSGSWNSDMKDQTNFEALKALEGSVKSGAALAEGAAAQASQQIAAVKAAEEKAKAEAEAAKAEAEAAGLAAQAAIAQAEAAKAQADAEKAKALQSQNNS